MKTQVVEPILNEPLIVDKISDLVGSIRMAQENQDDNEQQQHNRSSAENIPGFEQARVHSENTIIEAEKFKAAIAEPEGNYSNDSCCNHTHLTEVRPQVGMGLSDDDFFHLTCHIDESLKEKIERGNYVDLDRLLPHNKGMFLSRGSEECKYEWVRTDGVPYLAPARKENRINCFRRWEQAFCMYATIYCSAHPIRAREIWQYISVINTFSASFIWENVYQYDIVFRQLMEFNPSRSWAVTYTQMWNLTMTTPLG